MYLLEIEWQMDTICFVIGRPCICSLYRTFLEFVVMYSMSTVHAYTANKILNTDCNWIIQTLNFWQWFNTSFIAYIYFDYFYCHYVTRHSVSVTCVSFFVWIKLYLRKEIAVIVEKFQIKVSDKIHCNVVNDLLWAQVCWHEKSKHFPNLARNAELNQKVLGSNIKPEAGYPTLPDGFLIYSR